jgi:uncharacterized protein YhjY with autotransporter beta-barrel domain
MALWKTITWRSRLISNLAAQNAASKSSGAADAAEKQDGTFRAVEVGSALVRRMSDASCGCIVYY